MIHLIAALDAEARPLIWHCRRERDRTHPVCSGDDMVTSPSSIEQQLLDTLLSHAKHYRPEGKIRTWQRQL